MTSSPHSFSASFPEVDTVRAMISHEEPAVRVEQQAKRKGHIRAWLTP